MLDFGEELTIDTFKIPWLIWIQILVLLLLLILLYSFTLFSQDLPHNNNTRTPSSSASASPSSSSGPSSNLSHQSLPNNKPLLIKRISQPSQVGGSQSIIKGEISTSRIRRRVVGSGEEVATERESASSTSTSIDYHPCHYFKLARLAFLKCLGLDSSENSSSPDQTKER